MIIYTARFDIPVFLKTYQNPAPKTTLRFQKLGNPVP